MKIRHYGGAEVLEMTMDGNLTTIKLFWRSGLTEQPWSMISRKWITQLRKPPWQIKIDIPVETPYGERYRILEEASRTYGHSLSSIVEVKT